MVDIGLQQKVVGALEEERPRRLVPETIFRAVVDGMDRTVGVDVFAERKAHDAIAAESGIVIPRKSSRRAHEKRKPGSKPERGDGSS